IKKGTMTMETPDVFLTEDGRQDAMAKLEFLRTVKRAEVAQYLHDAKESGDVIDNAAYEDAKNEQARLEGYILKLEQMLAAAKPITKISSIQLHFGSLVVMRVVIARECPYTLVDAHEEIPSPCPISSKTA